MSLNAQVIKSSVWMVTLRLSMRGIGLVSTIILARLLSPEDFGLVAIIMSFFALIEVFCTFGFDTVLIQKQNATKDDYNTAWSFNFCFGLFACISIAFFSNLIADFFGNPKLLNIILVSSLIFLINGLVNIGVVDFRKNLTFDKEFKFQILPKILSFVCTISLAFWLRSYWALIFGTLIWKSLILISSYLSHDFRPRLQFKSWRGLFNFSKWLMVNNFFYFINMRAPELFVGKILSPEAAGFFTIAQEISTMPTTELASTVNRAVYPGYAKVSHKPEELKNLYLSVMESISFMVIPAGVGISAIAEILVSVVLGDKWTSSVELVQYLAIGGMFLALNSNTGYVFIASGNPKMSSIMGFIRVLVFIPLLLWLTTLFGLKGAAGAVLLTTIVVFFMILIFVFLTLRISIVKLIGVYLRPLIAAIIMYLNLYCLDSILYECSSGYAAIHLFLSITLGIVTYAGSVFLLWFVVGRPTGPEQSIVNFILRKVFDGN